MDPKYLVVRRGNDSVVFDFSTQSVTYTEGARDLLNVVKRNYSVAVVKKVAAKTGIKMNFTLKQVNARNLVLQRRA
jgi:hypothetical protein